jgi:EAL domain-containing protein (putative c-di-GMP-specific phosphodiesterase class I)
MGIEVIAEGVETEEQSTLLKSLNCDYVQGYYFGKPMPTKEFEKLFFNKVIDNVYPITLLQ